MATVARFIGREKQCPPCVGEDGGLLVNIDNLKHAAMELHMRENRGLSAIPYPPDNTCRFKVYATGILPGGRKIGLCMNMDPLNYIVFHSGLGHVQTVREWLSKRERCTLLPGTPVRKDSFGPYRPDRRDLHALPVRGCINRSLASEIHEYLEQFDATLHEDGIDASSRIMDELGIVPGGWHRMIPGNFVRLAGCVNEMFMSDVYHVTNPWQCFKYEPDMLFNPVRVAVSIDAEMNSGYAKVFPDARDCTHGEIACVGAVTSFVGDEAALGENRELPLNKVADRAVFYFCKADPNRVVSVPGTRVVRCRSEQELLQLLARHIFSVAQADLVCGHNIVGFDMCYFVERARHLYAKQKRAGHNCQPLMEFATFGCLRNHCLSLTGNGAPAGGIRMFTGEKPVHTNVPLGFGFAYVDTLPLTKGSRLKLRCYTLKSLCEHFLGTVNKLDMPYEAIPSICKEGTDTEWTQLLDYCVQDCVLPLLLIDKMGSVSFLSACARNMRLSICTLVLCGEGVKVRNALMPYVRKRNMVFAGVNDTWKRSPSSMESKKWIHGARYDPPNQGAQGGLVLEPVPGVHRKPICILDFASLYPSVQRSLELCWSTRLDPDLVERGAFYTDSERDPEKEAEGKVWCRKFSMRTGTFYFVRSDGDPERQGVLPKQLEHLLSLRNDFKAIAKDPKVDEQTRRNARLAEQAVKIIMNSAYGIANAAFGVMPCTALGTTTCGMGRQFNMEAKRWMEEHYPGIEIVYGDTDSLMVYFPEDGSVATASNRDRLLHAVVTGNECVEELNKYLRVKFSIAVKMELELVCFPFIVGENKKTYCGVPYAPVPKTIGALSPDLSEGTPTYTKGMRSVRRDVPIFIKRLSEEVMAAVVAQSEAEVIAVVCDWVTAIVNMRLDIGDYEITQEFTSKSALNQELTSAAQAISWNREHASPGAGCKKGEMVSFIMTTRTDPRRATFPPSLCKVRTCTLTNPCGKHVCKANAKYAKAREISEIGHCDVFPVPRRLFASASNSGSSSVLERKHIDVLYYVDAVFTALRQFPIMARKSTMNDLEKQARDFANRQRRLPVNERVQQFKMRSGSTLKNMFSAMHREMEEAKAKCKSEHEGESENKGEATKKQRLA